MEKAKRQRKSHNYSAAEKCRAVLLVWTEKRKPVEVCKEFAINWTTLGQWEKKAMEGMLGMLEPRMAGKNPALSPRLQEMLGLVRETAGLKLTERLKKLQDAKPPVEKT